MAICINSSNADAYNYKAIALCRLGRKKEAISASDKAIELGSECTTPYNTKGLALSYFRQYEEAIVVYNQALRL